MTEQELIDQLAKQATRANRAHVAFCVLLSLVALLMLATVGLRLVREFHERPVQVFICESLENPKCEEWDPR